MKKLLLPLVSVAFIITSCGEKKAEQGPYTGPAFHYGKEIKVTGEPLTVYMYLNEKDQKVRDTASLNKVMREAKNDKSDPSINVFLYDAKDLAESKGTLWLAKMSGGSKIEHNANYDAELKTYREEQKAKTAAKNLTKLGDILKNVQEYSAPDYLRKQLDITDEVGKFDKFLSDAEKLVDKNNPESNSAYNKVASAHKSKRGKVMTTLRKSYAKGRANDLWEKDFKVNTSGGDAKTISFVNFRFASNSEIKEFHEEEVKNLRALEFSRANYKWIDYGEYTYFDL